MGRLGIAEIRRPGVQVNVRPHGITLQRRPFALAVAVIVQVAAVGLLRLAPVIAGSPPPVSIGTVHGAFYLNPNNSGSLDTNQLSGTPVFSQDFPVIDFNPPAAAQVNCSNSSSLGVNENTRPFTDVIPQPDGTCTTIVAQGNGNQAGLGDLPLGLFAFQAIFTANLTVASPGDVTFNFFSDDGWMLGIGARIGGTEQPTQVSGANVNPLGATPGQKLPVVGSFNVPSAPANNPDTVSFTVAGTYPLELDYTECCGGQLAIVLGTTFGNPIPPNPVPTIAGVIPNWAPFTGNTSVTITGTNFGANPTVRFHGLCGAPGPANSGYAPCPSGFAGIFDSAATITASTSNSLTVTVPRISLYQVGALGDQNASQPTAVLEVDTSSGGATSPFTYVIPEIGRLFAHQANSTTFWPCTAEVVQSASASVLLTAAHCVTDPGDQTVRFDDFAFAPGYFGRWCSPTQLGASFVSSSQFVGCGGTAPYGVWCAQSSHTVNNVTLNDPACPNTPASTAVYPKDFYKSCDNIYADCHLYDFGYVVIAPRSDGVTLGQFIGGGLTITFNWGKSSFNQDWYIFGYNAGIPEGNADTATNWVASCKATSSLGSSDGAAVAVVSASDPQCTFAIPGASGGPWINSSNQAAYGIGANNDAASGGTVDGTYMGKRAEEIFKKIQSCTTGCPSGGL